MSDNGDNQRKVEKGVIGATADSHHTAGTIGTVGGGVAGAALGAALGPLGAVTGAVLGATFGTIAAKGIAEGIEPDADLEYWEPRFRSEPYHDPDFDFADYGPAYQMARRHYHPLTSFEAAEMAMRGEWAEGRGSSKLAWEQARLAAKANWERVHASHPHE
jgi:hypothetical protein